MTSENISENEKLKQEEKNLAFDNLKCDFFLERLFYIMKKKKYLEILKYNKKLQKRINLSINDYKDYSRLFSSIEIELKLVDNKYDKFINIPKQDQEYFHIYFDNSKEEIKRNYLNENENVKTIKIVINNRVKSFKNLFAQCEYISSINFKKFIRININNMSYMFFGCSSLNELNFSNFHTNRVTNMSNMFYGCKSLKKLNLSNFITKNVTNMSCMFQGCSSLKELNLSNFNTKNVTNMSCMFQECPSLETLKTL